MLLSEHVSFAQISCLCHSSCEFKKYKGQENIQIFYWKCSNINCGNNSNFSILYSSKQAMPNLILYCPAFLGSENWDLENCLLFGIQLNFQHILENIPRDHIE